MNLYHKEFRKYDIGRSRKITLSQFSDINATIFNIDAFDFSGCSVYHRRNIALYQIFIKNIALMNKLAKENE